MTNPPTSAGYTETQVREMLNNTAAVGGDRQAVAHILLFTDLPRMPVFHRFLETGTDTITVDGETREVTVVWVTDYWKLMDALGPALYGGLQELLTLADSLANGTEINLRKLLHCLGGHAHARTAIDAMLTASGYDGWYELVGTPALAEHERNLAALLG